MKTNVITNFPAFFGSGLSKSLFKDVDFSLNEFFPNKTWPPANVIKTDSGVNVELSVPGYSKNEIEVSVEGSDLNISFEKEQSKSDFLSKEFSYNYSKRSFTLPENCDKESIKTSMENGILKVEIPNKVVEPKKPTKKLIPVE